MLQAVQDYIRREQLFEHKDRLLLAVSGGVDSMLLAHLLWEGDYQLGIAHCNFKLRGAASDADEELVRNWATERGIPFFCEQFDTPLLLKDSQLSLQALARELRYAFFQKIWAQEDYDYIVTAHHADDQVETILMQMSKGCGIRGIRGMLPKNSRAVVRPLLFTSKSNIRGYAQLQGIPFREDASNDKDDYQRNLIRHKVVPVLRELNPQLAPTLRAHNERFREVERLYHQALQQQRDQLLRTEGARVLLSIEALEASPAPRSFLHEWLYPLGFSTEQIEQIWEGRNGDPGARYPSESHELLRDRGQWILHSKTLQQERKVLRDRTLQLPEGLLELRMLQPPFHFKSDPQYAYFDLESLELPLYLRHWEKGDSFCPFGMNGQHKKLSDFFIDEKYDQFQKERQWLLCSGEDIIWVMGKRSDERFKVQAQSQLVVEAHWQATASDEE